MLLFIDIIQSTKNTDIQIQNEYDLPYKINKIYFSEFYLWYDLLYNQWKFIRAIKSIYGYDYLYK